ncbi:MAG: hypothetical protein P4L51_08565 [Puia sp.]|nr:hypothetical protein [Puia sp.]
MPRRRNLNGIPHNITQSFFGTERYYSRGYMGDWLLNAARKLSLRKASLNVLDATFQPEELNIRPLVFHAKTLKDIIDKELSANGFPTDFIAEAHIDFQFPDQALYGRTIYCLPYLIDKDGRRYQSARIIAGGFEPNFDPFDKLNIYPTLKIAERLKIWSERKFFYRTFFWVSLFSLLSFFIRFGYWLSSVDIDNGGMGLIIFVPPIIMSVLLLIMSLLALFYYMKKGIKVSGGVFVVMFLLSIPVLLFGIFCLWILWR